MTIAPGTRLGAYEIAEPLGAGGMGTVYRAFQPGLGRYVAIKVLPSNASGDATFRQRFVQEALAVGRLRHPNIAAAFDFAQHEGVAYLVSELIDGGTLADQIGAPLPLGYVVKVLAPIASALDYAHSRGIVHRDVKPTNVLLQRDGTPVLTDFGLARIVGPGPGQTQAGSLVGTAAYIAPELVGGAEAGPPADQYALGIVAYELLTGAHPFPADNPLAALMAHTTKPVPRPREQGVTVAPYAEAAIVRALAKQPAERFPSATAFVDALAGTSPSREVPSSGRRRTLAVSGVLALAALALFAWPRAPEAAAPGYSATLLSTSPALSLDRGAAGECVVAYRNDGGAAWTQGTTSEIWLSLPDTVTQPVRGWVTDLGGGVVAAMKIANVEPSQIAIFSIVITVPADSTEGQATISVIPTDASGQIGADTSCLVNVR